ncbi:hypothetical protein FIBSPDRAFT_69140 [Athelia psychrophila]|uniref:Uncharacterized protein n=1 Tax=Athelia psychrophila TaxID=1759441 RepID=A0A166TRE1_9AGAM|nr:hypothetical protein FIBSPDRAFT_69140 [Fibularhizoctonia sp. CBS 109695]
MRSSSSWTTSLRTCRRNQGRASPSRRSILYGISAPSRLRHPKLAEAQYWAGLGVGVGLEAQTQH